MASSFGVDIKRAPAPVRASLEPIVRFFSYHDAHPVALGMVLLKQFDVDWLEWDSEALKSEIIETFKATSVSEHNWQKIQAFRSLMLVGSPWTEWEVFSMVIQAFNNNVPNPHTMQRATVAQLMAGVDIMSQIREDEFSPEVAAFVAACAVDQGLTYLPPPLDFAQSLLSEPSYRCKDCGNVDPLDLHDMRCDVCMGRYNTGSPLGTKADPDMPNEVGRNVAVFFRRDPTEAQHRFDQLKDLKEADIDEENPADVQAAKLVVGHKYVLLRRRQLDAQLEELKSWVSR
jgi:hypothetical protein